MADRLDKLENAVKKLATDMASLRSEMSEMKEDLSEVKEDVSEVKDAVANIQRTQTALTSAVTQAIKELGVSKTFDVRLSRLEAEVFGSKH